MISMQLEEAAFEAVRRFDVALTVSQYNSILRQYEEQQTRNRHLHDQRLHHIYETVPGYQALDEAVASTSVAQGKKMLAGDTNALAQLKDQLKDLARKRASPFAGKRLPDRFSRSDLRLS